VSEREKFEAWATDHQTTDGYPQYTPFDAWQASRRAALEEAAKTCEALNDEPASWGTPTDCADAVRALADGDTHD
jgi:hypothetical protein